MNEIYIKRENPTIFVVDLSNISILDKCNRVFMITIISKRREDLKERM